MIDFFCSYTLRMIVFFASVLMLVASIVTAYIAMYLYGKEKQAGGIATVLLYIPWIIVFVVAAIKIPCLSRVGTLGFIIASLCDGIPHCFYLTTGGTRLKTAAILGIISVVCVTQMWTGFFAFAIL